LEHLSLMQPQAFYRAVADDFNAVDEIIKKQLTSRVPLVSKIGDYITSAGGKRLRPLLVLLCGKALGRDGEDLRLLAATIEFLHTATLLHDDVVDMSGMRRGRSTANAMWGNAPSVLVGDFLYSRSFEMMVELGSMPVMRILSQATRIIAEGEVLQLSKVRDASTSEETYMEVIRGKTAMLFEASTHSAAALAQAPDAQREALRMFGDHLGVAFQLVDDLLDYRGDAETLGKNVGDDLAEGKPTLPLIYAMREGTAEQAALVRRAIQKGGIEDLEHIREAVENSGALDYTARMARDYVARAIECLNVLPPSEYRDALVELSEFAVARTH
jgi:octaprenyl-diphosphate synthase